MKTSWSQVLFLLPLLHIFRTFVPIHLAMELSRRVCVCAQKIYLHALGFCLLSGPKNACLCCWWRCCCCVCICLFKAKKSTGIQTHIKYSNCIQIGGIWLFIIVGVCACVCVLFFVLLPSLAMRFWAAGSSFTPHAYSLTITYTGHSGS